VMAAVMAAVMATVTEAKSRKGLRENHKSTKYHGGGGRESPKRMRCCGRTYSRM
jgi:hypothetical protein